MTTSTSTSCSTSCSTSSPSGSTDSGSSSPSGSTDSSPSSPSGPSGPSCNRVGSKSTMPVRKERAAGVLIFVHKSQLARFHVCLNKLNHPTGRVSDEVLSLHCVTPSRKAVQQLCAQLQVQLKSSNVESLSKLKPNNSLRDLTASWRIPPHIVSEFYLVVGLETVTDAFRKKYPHPNLTLHAGKIEEGESTLDAALRELFEETRIKVSAVDGPPIGLMSKGMVMFSVYVMHYTGLHMQEDNTLLIS